MSFQQEKKDIVLISSGEKKSGVYRVESELIDEWVKQGHKVSIVLVNGRITHDSFGIMAIVEEKDEPHFKPFALVHRFFRLQKFFRIHKDATILALSISADCFAALFGRTVRNKVVISERNDPNQYPDSVIYKKFRDFCFRLVDACVFQTQEACNYFPESVRKKGVIIPNPINNKIPEFERTEINKTVMSTGRLKPQKNFPLLIKAFAGFSKSFSDYTLEIYGDGYLHQELEDLASEFGVHSKVRFMPFTTDIFPVMAKASMFVMSSNYEGISNSMLEAMAIGVPTICTDCPVGGARQMIEDGVNGLLVPVGDVEALANAMCKVAADKDYAEMLGRNGHEIRKKYPIEVIARKWIDVL